MSPPVKRPPAPPGYAYTGGGGAIAPLSPSEPYVPPNWQQTGGPSTTNPGHTAQPAKSSTTYKGPGAQSAQSTSTVPRLLSDLDTLLNAHGALGSLNVVDDVKVFIARAAVVGVGAMLGTAGLVLVISSVWGKTPPAIKTAAEVTGGTAVAGAVA